MDFSVTCHQNLYHSIFNYIRKFRLEKPDGFGAHLKFFKNYAAIYFSDKRLIDQFLRKNIVSKQVVQLKIRNSLEFKDCKE